MSPSIVVIDDEPNIAEVIRLYLEHAGYMPHLYYSGKGAVAEIERIGPDLVILDVMLPEMSGFDVCRELRELPGSIARTPVILLTAKGESIDKLRGFTIGADDYVVKPFDPNELVARVKAVLRRCVEASHRNADAKGEEAKPPLSAAGITIDAERYKVTVDGNRVDLTPKEIELLHFLMRNKGRVYSRDDLLEHVWRFDFGGNTRTVDAHVKNLRKKLGAHPGWSITTLWGIGYSFEVTQHGR